MDALYSTYSAYEYITDEIKFYAASLGSYPSFINSMVKLHSVVDILPRTRQSRVFFASKVSLPVKSGSASYVLTGTGIR